MQTNPHDGQIPSKGLPGKNAELDGGAVNRGQLFVTERASDVRADEWN